MSDTPLISVVMPVFNGARFLGAAVASVRAQTLRDFEFVIVDDGSTDATPSMLAEAARRDSRIEIVSHAANQGVVAARNAGMRRAKGRFIAVMDSDDVALPDRFARQVSFLDAHPDISALGGTIQFIDQDDVLGPTKAYPLQPALIAWSMLFFNSIAHSTLMLRKPCLRNEYPAGGAEDYALLADLSLHVRLANLPDVLVRYRTWPGALTRRTWERQEQHANEVVQRAIVDISGQSVSLDQVRILRGLSRDQYPSAPSEIRTTAELIRTLAPMVADRMTPLGVDVTAIRRDAGVRLWLLAALALRPSPVLASSIAAQAFGMSRMSIVDFTGKVARRMLLSRRT